MITKAAIHTGRSAPQSQHMVGNRIAAPHRFHLTDGRVLTGELYKVPTVRLADHLATLKGYISSTNVRCERTGESFAYVAISTAHVLFIEELPRAAETSRFAPPAGVR